MHTGVTDREWKATILTSLFSSDKQRTFDLHKKSMLGNMTRLAHKKEKLNRGRKF